MWTALMALLPVPNLAKLKLVLMAAAVIGPAVFATVITHKVDEAKYVKRELEIERATTAEHDRRMAVLEQAQRDAQARASHGAELEKQNANLQAEINHRFAGNGGGTCLDAERLRWLEGSGGQQAGNGTVKPAGKPTVVHRRRVRQPEPTAG